MDKSKAIETCYKGYRFRSRLEARWAIFFDVMGIEWQYEVEGYQFADGTRYLPDFYLPVVEMWAEVKPVELTTEEWYKAALLSELTGHEVLKLVGVPDFKEYYAVSHEIHRHNPSFTLAIDLGWYYDEHRFPCMYCHEESHFDDFFPGYANAVNAARSARFEYGETP